MKNSVRVLIVHESYKLAGGEDTVFRKESEMLRNEGIPVFTYLRHNSELDGMNVFQLLMVAFSSFFSLRTFFQIRKIIKENNISIVHVHNTVPIIGPAVYYAAWSMHIPVIQTVHNFRLLCPCGTLVHNGIICESSIIHGLHCAVRDRCYHHSFVQTALLASALKLHRMMGTYHRVYYICLTDFNRNMLIKVNQYSKHEIFDPKKIFVKPNFV